MTGDAAAPADDGLPQAVIDQIEQWVEETVVAAKTPAHSSILDAIRASSAIDDVYQRHLSKLRGEALEQHVRAVLQVAHDWRKKYGPRYAKLYNHGLRQRDYEIEQLFARQFVVDRFEERILGRKLPLTSALIDDAIRSLDDDRADFNRIGRVLKLTEEFVETNELSADGREILARHHEYCKSMRLNDFVRRIDRLISGESRCPLEPGDAWSDAAIAELNDLDEASRTQWLDLLVHAGVVNPTKPGKKWCEEASKLLDAAARVEFNKRVPGWLRLVGERGTVPRKIMPWRDATDETVLADANRAIAIGLVWMLASNGGDVAVLSHVARASLKRIALGQLRCEPLGNAAVRALGSISGDSGIGQLAQLEILVRAPKPRKLIRKTLQEAAEREGISVIDLEETAIPDLGIRDGRVRRAFGDFGVEIVPAGDKAQVTWIASDGAPKKSIPKQLKAQYAGAQEEIKQLVSQLETLLPAQRVRLDRLMKSTRAWPAKRWRARYLEHPLVALIARRLIWTVNGRAVVPQGDALVDVEGSEVAVADDDEVRLWHPIGRDLAEVTGWRERIESLLISQPFKQAHREVYLLTDAERRTNTYSNRFGAHILKNTTMVVLCQTRGWVTGLFGGQTGPRLDLPDLGVRAEFWVEPAGDNYTDFGAPVYVATDQVRFYPLSLADGERLGHEGGLIEPLPLERVPPQALTEAMRDIDLFIGLSSVGNDPNWSDGGPDGRYRTYWQSYSFGDLNESAKTRRDALQRIVPRLDIANRCQLTDRFLRVAGQVRAYKIHLGSANILMEPNDQYLCIVPDRRADELGNRVFLPFDGDRTLSLILSKALMLANDTGITDPTIISQLRGR